MRDDRPNPIVEMTFVFSLSVIEFCENLNELKIDNLMIIGNSLNKF